METVRTIKLPTLSFSQQKVVRRIRHEIELHEDHIYLIKEFWAEERPELDEGGYDESIPMQEVYNYWERFLKRDHLAGVETVHCKFEKKWLVRISVNGIRDDIDSYFLKAEDAKDFASSIYHYIFCKHYGI